MSDIVISALSDVLEKVILPSVERNVYEKSAMMQLFFGYSPEKQEAVRKNAMGVTFQNDKVYFTVLTDLNPSAMGYAEDETLRSGKSTTAQGYLPIATVAGSTTISKQALNIKNKGAIVNIVQFETTNLINSLAMEINRQIYGDGSGTVATTATSGSNTTSIPLSASTNGDIDYSEYFPLGTYIKVGSSLAVKVVGKSTNSLTVDNAISYNAGDPIKKVTGSGTTATELTGLAKIVKDSDTYANINPSTYPVWKAYVDSTAEALSLSKMHKAYYKANKLGSVDYIFMNQTLFQKYGTLLEGKIQFQAKDVLYGGWKGITYMGGLATVVLDYMCPDDRVYFLSSKKLVGMEYQPFEFEKGTDGNLLRIANKLSYELVASWMGQVGTFVRGAHAVLTNKTA
ncbi:MAG: phage major capsid protein [Candidatus Aenigmatarchaeota archaeon]